VEPQVGWSADNLKPISPYFSSLNTRATCGSPELGHLRLSTQGQQLGPRESMAPLVGVELPSADFYHSLQSWWGLTDITNFRVSYIIIVLANVYIHIHIYRSKSFQLNHQNAFYNSWQKNIVVISRKRRNLSLQSKK
jgi:hypothetical protein